ncbi:hypothetical protein M5X00_26085 [Paenibacillus alvei]|uniref:hypothetical protein n=1 Tax=Paenibacillus alvei TaxID=44250 RepID=UPI0002896A41|nr:hypothetical protein [Paenibacillus alvei]EJW13916.1 hypothetical protein PAV_141p00220 [Paenibacillus alvei DSM 29]MCY9544708.1 hypothetical protein [Paenibacillus alvei]MCY9707720.1 hypothetical protein [Paenibacillus alvei]MCY9757701.1 hypothetical protein [Paenibacillus alvei]MEC0082767.1 hypothetical protein [Paenibacillus alvei]
MGIVLGIVGIVASILLGLYMGVYVCFVGGAVDIIHEIVNAVNGADLSVLAILWGIVKMSISGLVGWISFYVLFIPSAVVLGLKSK